MAATALQKTLELPRILVGPAESEPPRLADGVELIGRFED
jgi:hypothetical protein